MLQCDENRPKCGRCEKGSKDCSFAKELNRLGGCGSTDRLILPNAPLDLQRLAEAGCVNSHSLRIFMEYSYIKSVASLSPPHLQPVPIGDLELLHATRSDGHGLTVDLDDDIQLGFSFPYVLHIILSLSALRMFEKNPARNELLQEASRHQNRALTLVKPNLADLSNHNIDAVLRFSFMAAIAALGRPLRRHAEVPLGLEQDPITDIIHSFNMTRGIKFITERKWLLSGESYEGGGFDLSEEDPWQQGLCTKFAVYPVVRQLILDNCAPGAETLVCLDAIRKVFSFIDLIEQDPDLFHDARLIQIWPIELDQRFIDLLVSRHQIAILILGYYSLLLKLRSGNTWPFKAWPSLLLQRVEEVLGEKWACHLWWPKFQILGFEDELDYDFCDDDVRALYAVAT